MHVLIVNRHVFDTVGGSEAQCHQIANRLAALGHVVTYAVCAPKRLSYDTRYISVPLSGPLVPAFRDILRTRRPDVVYWRRNKTYLFRCVMAARREGVPFVFAVSSSMDLRPFGTRVPSMRSRGIPGALLFVPVLIARRFRSALNYCALRLVDGVVFQHAGQASNRRHRRQRIIYNCGSRPEAAPAHGLAPYVLWVGSLKPVKSPEIYIRLAADLGGEGVEFWMAGVIQDPGYERLIEGPHRLPAKLRYLGARPPASIDALLSGSLFLVSTSRDEGFPNVFIEAWRQRKCVASLNCDLGGLLQSEQIGVFAPDYESFRNEVLRLIRDRELRESMGRRAFEFVSIHCEPDRCVKQLESFLIEVTSA